jgi:hypothetical protein
LRACCRRSRITTGGFLIQLPSYRTKPRFSTFLLLISPETRCVLSRCFLPDCRLPRSLPAFDLQPRGLSSLSILTSSFLSRRLPC